MNLELFRIILYAVVTVAYMLTWLIVFEWWIDIPLVAFFGWMNYEAWRNYVKLRDKD